MGNTLIRVNVDDKKIKLKFRVYGDDFEESTEIMKGESDYLYPEKRHIRFTNSKKY